MMKLRKIEEQIQEITFFLSVITAFSLFISGIFYLTLNTESLIYIMGQFGVLLQEQLFTLFGYAFFYLAIVALHMGYIANFHIYNFRDIKREYPVLLYSGIAHLIILSLFASSLSVIQIYMDMPSRDLLAYGSGGLAGLSLGGSLYQVIGVYGSVIILAIVALITAILADFFELPELLQNIRYFSTVSAQKTVNGVKSLNSGMNNGLFFLKNNELAEATASASQNTKNWISRANTIITDHFHIYEDRIFKRKVDSKQPTQNTKKKTTSKKQTTSPKKKTAKKTTSKKKTTRKKTTTSRKKKTTKKK